MRRLVSRCLFLSFFSILLLCFAAPRARSATLVQKNSNTGGTQVQGGVAVQVGFTNPNTAGNLIIVSAGWVNGGTASVSDSNNNTYFTAVGPPASGYASQIWYAANIVGGTNTVTVTFNTSFNDVVSVFEYSGLITSSPLDVTASNTGNGNSLDTGSVTTSQANELVFATGFDTGQLSPGPNYSLEQQTVWQNAEYLGAEDRNGTTAGTYNATFSDASTDNWVAQIATFKASASSGPLLCGQLDDGQVHTPPNYTTPLAPPAKGATNFFDPQYGCNIVRLTDAVGDNLGAGAHHIYGTITPVNADDTYVMILLENGSKEIVDTAGNVIVPVTNMPDTSSGNLPWDISATTRFYYTTNTGAKLVRGDITGLPSCASTHNCAVQTTTLHDFSSSYGTVLIPDDEDISEDNDHLWLVGDTKAFLYTISTDTVSAATLNVGTKDSPTGWHKIQIMPSNRMLMTWEAPGSSNGQGQEIYNTNATLNWHMLNNSLHTDCGRDLNGDEVCVIARIPDLGGNIDPTNACPTFQPSSGQDGGADVINMSTHAAQCLVDLNWKDSEISFRDGHAGAGWVFITIFNNGACPTYSCFDTTTPSHLDPNWATNWVHFAEEGLLVRIDNNNSGNAYRLFHSRSRSSEYYWAIPRGAISRDGKYLIFDSNFDISSTGLVNYTDVYSVKIQ